MTERAAIAFNNVAFAYPGRSVLDNLNLTVQPGEFVALMGGNGSGKSTLLRLACGLLQPARGTVEVLGHRTTKERGFAARRRCGIVFQNPDDQLVASIVENEVAFGPENLGLPRDEIRARVTEALAAADLAGFEERQTHSLSGGQKQRLALAGALAMRPDVLLLDEASSMLDPAARATFLSTIRRLHAAGMTILMATHDEAEAAQATRLITLQDGAIVSDTATDQVCGKGTVLMSHGTAPSAPESAAEGPSEAFTKRVPQRTGMSSGHSCRARTAERLKASEGPSADNLEYDHVTYCYEDDGTPRTALQDICLTVRDGELLAVTGRTGSGKSTLIQHANGLLHPTAGRVLFRNLNIAEKPNANLARRSVGLVMQYPEQQLFAPTVYEDVAFGPKNLGLTADEADARVRTALDQVNLSFEELANRSPFQLSGGQQRRVAIAGVLAMQPDILVLDEPCAGLDPAAHAALVQLLGDLHEAGQTIIMVSHDENDVAALATRVVRMEQGQLYAN